jgi:hypothetical protein
MSGEFTYFLRRHRVGGFNAPLSSGRECTVLSPRSVTRGRSASARVPAAAGPHAMLEALAEIRKRGAGVSRRWPSPLVKRRRDGASSADLAIGAEWIPLQSL